jgi:hypothetical protein
VKLTVSKNLGLSFGVILALSRINLLTRSFTNTGQRDPLSLQTL